MSLIKWCDLQARMREGEVGESVSTERMAEHILDELKSSPTRVKRCNKESIIVPFYKDAYVVLNRMDVFQIMRLVNAQLVDFKVTIIRDTDLGIQLFIEVDM